MAVNLDRNTITLGNVLSMLMTGLALVTAVITATSAVSSVREQMAVKDKELETRIGAVENYVVQAKSDHDIIIEIRADLKAIRLAIDKAEKGMR